MTDSTSGERVIVITFLVGIAFLVAGLGMIAGGVDALLGLPALLIYLGLLGAVFGVVLIRIVLAGHK